MATLELITLTGLPQILITIIVIAILLGIYDTIFGLALLYNYNNNYLFTPSNDFLIILCLSLLPTPGPGCALD